MFDRVDGPDGGKEGCLGTLAAIRVEMVDFPNRTSSCKVALRRREGLGQPTGPVFESKPQTEPDVIADRMSPPPIEEA